MANLSINAPSTPAIEVTGDEWREVSCNGEDGRNWKEHLSEGRVSPVVWEQVTKLRTGGSTCGW